jgi:hypothetical protein
MRTNIESARLQASPELVATIVVLIPVAVLVCVLVGPIIGVGMARKAAKRWLGKRRR